MPRPTQAECDGLLAAFELVAQRNGELRSWLLIIWDEGMLTNEEIQAALETPIPDLRAEARRQRRNPSKYPTDRQQRILRGDYEAP